jgi:hypothetical protein
MSETGPGNPYWKRPAGSTGGMMGREPCLGTPIGSGGGGAAREGAVALVVVVVVVTVSSRLERPYAAAVVAAPMAADVPATRARVNLDMADIHWQTQQQRGGQPLLMLRGRLCRGQNTHNHHHMLLVTVICTRKLRPARLHTPVRPRAFKPS